MAEHWMQKAFADSHGQFKAKAKKAGMGTEAYAQKEKHDPNASTHTKRQANLAALGAKYGGGHRSSKAHSFSGTHRSGDHRVSGHSGAHRIGKR